MKKTKAVLLGVILWSLLLISGCNFIRIEEEPRKPLEYSIVKNEDLPAELAALIQEKKANERWLQHFRGRTGRHLPGSFFPDAADRSIRWEGGTQPAVLSLYCSENGVSKGAGHI